MPKRRYPCPEWQKPLLTLLVLLHIHNALFLVLSEIERVQQGCNCCLLAIFGTQRQQAQDLLGHISNVLRNHVGAGAQMETERPFA
jgi:hypothetical protein